MKRGYLYRRCTKCGARVTERRCRCGGESISWTFVVDAAAPGERRKQVSRSGFATKGEAVAAMSRLQVEKSEGTHIEPSRLTLGAYLERWVNAGCGGVRDWTLRGYGSVVKHHLIPTLGSLPLQKLTRTDIKALYAGLRASGSVKGRKAGTGLSEKSVHNVHICLRAALNDAVEDGLLRTNPASKALKPPEGGDEMVTWTREELTAFLHSVSGTGDYALFRVAAYSGLRRGELLGLRWVDVKRQLRSISIQQQLGLRKDAEGMRELAPVKTKHGRRSVPLDEATLQVLDDLRQAQEFQRRRWGSAYRDLGLLFCRPDGSPHDPDSITGRFEQLVKASGLRRLRLHDLRHTAATLLLEAGVDISVVSRLLGHADVGFTARVYAHVTERLQRDAADKLSAYLEPRAGVSVL